MKNNTRHHHALPQIDALPHAVPTRFMYAGLSASIDRLKARAGDPRMWKVLKLLRQQVKSLFNLEKPNFEKWLRCRLQRDDSFRARVLTELGGERALRRWERRAGADAQPAQTRPSRPSQSSKTGCKSGATAGPKTDALGLFRLAPIKAASVRKSTFAHAGSRGSAQPRPLAPFFPAVKVTPYELRGHAGRLETNAQERLKDDPAPSIDPDTLWNLMMVPIMCALDRLGEIETAMRLADICISADNARIGDYPAGRSQDNRPARDVLCPT